MVYLLQLFDHIAECLANFMVENNVGNERLPLGFTFSFPLIQKGLTKGILQQWTKGFDCSGCVGEDVVRLLKDALARRNVSLWDRYS
jgi:hexokinase